MVPLAAMSVLSCCWTVVTLSIGRSFAVHFFVYDGALVTPVRESGGGRVGSMFSLSVMPLR